MSAFAAVANQPPDWASVGRFPAPDAYLVCAKTMRWVPRVQSVIEQLRNLLSEVEGLRRL